MCSMTEVIDYAAVNAGALDPDILSFAAGTQARQREGRGLFGVPLAASWLPTWVK